ncbi:MAG: DUF1934 domain-containing protein [Clostridia bacterium]|nr:DUF1934 domain-containing protein [Clostridia bacterium]
MTELNNNCLVTLKSRQIMLGDEDTSVIKVPALRTEKNGKTYIYYTVFYDDDNQIANKETVKIVSDDCVELLRSGLLKSKMVFKKGETTSSVYASPAGQMMMSITTDELDIEQSEKKLVINMKYKIALDNDADILIYFKLTSESN